MLSFEDRIRTGVNKGIADTVWGNEEKSILKIINKCKNQDDSLNSEVELEEMGHGRYKLKSGNVQIIYDDGRLYENQIEYRMRSAETGFVRFAKITPERVYFLKHGNKSTWLKNVDATGTYPYFSKKERERLGEEKGWYEEEVMGLETEEELVPLSEVKDTAIETIEQQVRQHPTMSKYADMILGDFNSILSLDSEREIEPISEVAMINATLQEDNQRKDIQIGKLQEMLNKALEFATKVRDSVVGKMFFKKSIQELDLADKNNQLPDNSER